MKKLRCLRCNHTWYPRGKNKTKNRPNICPKCHATSWDEEGVCPICKRTFIDLNSHHKDGNHKNNKKENIINICRDCHSAVHYGINNHKRRSRKKYSVFETLRIKELQSKLNIKET